MDETPGVVLAVYAHPDDADVGCGGALARWAKAGSAVHLVVCTDGGKGTSDPEVVPAHLAAERAGELEASSALIGLSSVGNLGFPDGELTDSDDFRRTLVARVRALRPDARVRARSHGGVLRAGLLQPPRPPHRRRRAARRRGARRRRCRTTSPMPARPTRCRPSSCRGRSNPTSGST